MAEAPCYAQHTAYSPEPIYLESEVKYITGNKGTKHLKTARLNLSVGLNSQNYTFDGVSIESLVDLYTTLGEFFESRPAIKEEVERVLALRKLESMEKPR
jgi:hypothetical protein